MLDASEETDGDYQGLELTVADEENVDFVSKTIKFLPLLSQLVSLGFTRDFCYQAYLGCSKNLEKAIEFLKTGKK